MRLGQKIKPTYTPFKILVYLMYAPADQVNWISKLGPNKLLIKTGPAARAFRMQSIRFWEALDWLVDYELIEKMVKPRKRGQVILYLAKPENITFSEGTEIAEKDTE